MQTGLSEIELPLDEGEAENSFNAREDQLLFADLAVRDELQNLLPSEDPTLLHHLAERALSRLETDDCLFAAPPPVEAIESFRFLLACFQRIAKFGPLIHCVTRRDLIEAGQLVEAPEKDCREAGFTVPVALTREVWGSYVEVPKGVTLQSEAGRLWDILYMLRLAIARNRSEPDTLLYSLYVRNDNHAPRPVQLKAVIGPDDAGEPVITILLPDQD
jgi:hypothetical protein